MTTEVSEPTTVFDGNKFFWRTRNVVDVTIVQHLHNSVYEVIVYEPTFDMEAPRLYLNSEALMTLIDEVEIETKLSFAIRNGIPMTDKFVQSVRNGVISEFVLTRLLIKDMDRENKVFTVELKTKSADVLAGICLLCPAPASLCPYQTRHFRHLMEGEVDRALTMLKQEAKDLHDTTENAATLAGLTVRQRWRIPLVMGKILRGKRLPSADAKIFSHVKANMKTDEDAARMKATLRVDTTCRTRTARAGRTIRSPKQSKRGKSTLLTATTSSSLHKAATAASTPTSASRRNEKSAKSGHHKRSSKIASPTNGLARKKFKLQVTGAAADGAGEVSDSNFKRLMSGLTQLGASLRVNLGLQATSSKKSEPVSPHTPTVHYNAQAALSESQDEEPPVCTADPTPAAARDLTLLTAGGRSMSFDDTLTDARVAAALRGHDAQAPQQLQLLHSHDAVDEEVDSQESPEAAIKPKPTKRPSMLAAFLLAFTSGLNSSFSTGGAASHKEGSDRAGSQRTSFLHTGLSLWGSAKSKVVPGD